jgi:hypothetical protein
MNSRHVTLLGLLIGALVFTTACGMVNTLLGASTSAGTVSELWDDVPRLDGLEKANLEMPLAARLAIQAITQGRINFISFTTSKTPQEVQAFYTQERMQAAGWNASDTTGCIGGEDDTTSEAAICMFGKETDGRNELLAIVVARDAESQETQLFFARVDASEPQQSQ